jgi:cytidylate kinase
LAAPLEYRIKHVQEVFKYSKKVAADYIKKEDASRHKYLKSHFFHEPDDPTLYHIIINMDKFSYEESASVIADAVMKKFPKSFI